jgi:hypothetical protein
MPSLVSSIARNTIVRRALAVFALVFVIVWMPSIKIIFYNVTEENLSIVDLFIINLGIAALAALLALAFVWSRVLWLLGLSLLLGLGAAAVLNTFLIPSGPNVLDGIMESDGGLVLKRAVTVGAVVASLGLFVFLLMRKEAAFSLARAVTIGVCSYAAFFSAMALWTVPVGSSLLLDPAEVVGLQLSPERNILIVSFDQMQGSVVRGVLRRNPELAARLDGFTFFPDAASVYPNTSYSLSSVLLGRVPTGPEEYFDAVIPQQNILRAGQAKGYAPGWTFAQQVCDICSPKTPAGFERARVAEQAAQLYSLAVQQAFGIGVRTVAFLAQPFVRQKLGPTATRASWKLDADAFQVSVRNAHLTSDRPVVQYRHYFATHQPILYDKDCRVKDQLEVRANQSLAGAEGEITCVLTRFGEFVDKLKELGVYDRTMLFLVSDHGYESSINASEEPLAREFLFPGSATLGPQNIKPAGAYNPSLFFKDFGQRGPLREVGSPASLIDVSATVCAAMDGCGLPLEGHSLTDAIPDDRVLWFWRYFGGDETRFDGGEDRLHKGMGKWWERRSFTGTIPAGLVPALARPPEEADAPQLLTK